MTVHNKCQRQREKGIWGETTWKKGSFQQVKFEHLSIQLAKKNLVYLNSTEAYMVLY